MAPLRTARMTAPAGRARCHTAAAVGFEVRPCTEHTGILHTHSTRPLWRSPPATQRCPIHCHCRAALHHLQLRSKLLVVAACVWTIWRASPPFRSQMQSCALRRSRCADTTTTTTAAAAAAAAAAVAALCSCSLRLAARPHMTCTDDASASWAALPVVGRPPPAPPPTYSSHHTGPGWWQLCQRAHCGGAPGLEPLHSHGGAQQRSASLRYCSAAYWLLFKLLQRLLLAAAAAGECGPRQAAGRPIHCCDASLLRACVHVCVCVRVLCCAQIGGDEIGQGMLR
jgi:hypothetical protein